MDIGSIIFWVVLVFYIISIYNNLVTYRNRYQNAFSQIEVQLKRRYDLIPNLVETAKAYMTHERETLETVTRARNEAAAVLQGAVQDPGGVAIKQLANAEGALHGALGRLNLVMEDYPELRANENMMQLSDELTITENRVAFARQAFNDAVMTYNTYRQSFPPVFFAPYFGHPEDANLLEFADSAEIQVAPKVSF